MSAQTQEWTAMIDKQIVEEMEMHERHSETVSTIPERLYLALAYLYGSTLVLNWVVNVVLSLWHHFKTIDKHIFTDNIFALNCIHEEKWSS